MKPGPASPPDASQLAQRADALRQELSVIEPRLLAERAGAAFTPTGEGGELRLPVWEREVRIPFPMLTAVDAQSGRECPLPTQALLLYYLGSASGQPLAGRWVSFAELPGGRFYNQAFQGYTGGEMARAFGHRLADFERAARLAGGRDPQAESGPILGDAALAFLPLPRVPLLAMAWRGDEDFASAYQVLFDASASGYLPTDVCAILGSMLTRRILTPAA